MEKLRAWRWKNRKKIYRFFEGIKARESLLTWQIIILPMTYRSTWKGERDLWHRLLWRLQETEPYRKLNWKCSVSHFLIPSLRSSIRFYNRENFRTMFPLSQAKPILWLRWYRYGYAMHLTSSDLYNIYIYIGARFVRKLIMRKYFAYFHESTKIFSILITFK